MRTTKSEILAHLKRTGGSSIEELATSLGLARMTVRQHLAMLERDALVSSREVRRATGRPHYVFSLTDRGEEMFPKRYDRLAGLILEEASLLDGAEISGLTPAEKRRLLFDKMVGRLHHQYEAKVAGKALKERVEAVAGILDEEGGFAEWRPVNGGFEIADYNCVYRRVVDSHDDLCDWHLSLLSRLLGNDVSCTQFMSKGAECCRFVVEGGEAAPATTEEGEAR
ncbi:MAG TPA: winged helix-turn-helix transcriptional regulator [Dehalococcoidia bacterium]|nr:winged helix-turn-helix transcriptional regulator [Dehalococcoidia bacterium]